MENKFDLVPIESESALALRPQSPLIEWHGKPETCREEGKNRYLLVQQARTIRRKNTKKTKALIEYARSKGISPATIRNYLKIADKALEEARRTGANETMVQIMALTPGYGANKGNYRAFSTEAIDHAKALYLSQKLLNISDVYRNVANESSIKGWKVGSEDALRYILKQETSQSLLTMARKGFRRYQADCEVKILRDYSEIPPNFMWCGDHHIFDVFVRAPGNKVLRPWVTAWIDMASRSFMGWCLSFQPDSRTIALALAHAICNKNDDKFPQHGLPTSVYIDNGKDYRCKYLSGEEVSIGRIDYPEIIKNFSTHGIEPFYIDLEYDPEQEAWVKERGEQNIIVKKVRVGGVFARLGISQRFATAYHPWAKPIERTFRNVVQSFSRQLPGWCGSGHEQRPEKLTQELKRGSILDFREFCECWYQWAIRYNNDTPHSGHGMNGRTPTEVFLSGGLPEEVDPDLLTFALLKKEQVRVYNWGLKLNGQDFELAVSNDLSGASILNKLINTYVTLFYDPDLKIIRVYQEGRYVCDARPLRRASFVRPDDPVLEEKAKLQALQRRQNRTVLEGMRQKALPKADYLEPAPIMPCSKSELQPPRLVENSPCQTKFPEIKTSLEYCPTSKQERYQIILELLTTQGDLCEEDKLWQLEYQQTEEYERMKPLYEADLSYKQYCAARGA